MLMIKLPPAWSLEFAHGLKPGDVYLPEESDPRPASARWGVVRLASVKGDTVSVWHVDAALDGPPSAVFLIHDGVFVADYSNQRALEEYQQREAEPRHGGADR